MKYYIKKRKIEIIAMIMSFITGFSTLFTLSLSDTDVVKAVIFFICAIYIMYLISNDTKEINKRLKRKKKNKSYNYKSYDDIAFEVYERRLCYGENCKKMSETSKAA